MKKVIFGILFFNFLTAGFGQSPASFNYQAALRDNSGNPLVSTAVKLRFSIREGTPTGTVLFQETHAKTTGSTGLVNCLVGTGSLVSGAYPTTTQWAVGFKYLQVEVDPAGGNSFIDLGTSQIVSVPFANFSNGSQQANSLSGSATVAPSQITSGSASTGQILKWNGSNWVPSNETTGGGGSGDITDVVAGTGLSGGGTTGSVTITAQTSTALWNASQLQGTNISSTSPSSGQILKYNGSTWAPANEATGSSGTITGVTAGTGLTGGGTSGTVSVSALNTTALWNANLLQGFTVSANTPTLGKVLKYNGTTWIPSNDSIGTITAGTGLSMSGSVINSRWTSRSNDLHNNNTGHVSINSDTALARLYVKNSTTRNAILAGTAYPHRAAIFGYSDTADMGFYLTSAGVLGYGKGGYTAAGVSGVSGGTGEFNLGLYSQSKVLGPTGTRNYGIYNDVWSSNIYGIGIFNILRARTNTANGIYGSYNQVRGSADADAVAGYFACAPNNPSYSNYGIYAFADSGSTNIAGYFDGDVTVGGTLAKSGGTFKIDHPQDPENKYLIHSFVESPDMMNVYNGNIVTDANGYATVKLPTYFESENIDFKYQLTVIGQFAQAIINKEISANEFVIQTNVPNVKVSWQVTGVRNDVWAQKHRVVAELEKADKDKGKYVNPLEYNKPRTSGIHYIETKGTAMEEKP